MAGEFEPRFAAAAIRTGESDQRIDILFIVDNVVVAPMKVISLNHHSQFIQKYANRIREPGDLFMSIVCNTYNKMLFAFHNYTMGQYFHFQLLRLFLCIIQKE